MLNYEYKFKYCTFYDDKDIHTTSTIIIAVTCHERFIFVIYSAICLCFHQFHGLISNCNCKTSAWYYYACAVAGNCKYAFIYYTGIVLGIISCKKNWE